MAADSSALIAEGRRLLDAGRAEEALALFEQLAESDPGSDVAYCGQADAARALGRLEDAADACETGLAFFPDSIALRLALARVRQESGAAGEALRLLSEATTLAPNDAGAWLALGKLYATRDEVEAAQSAFDHALRLDPQDIAALGNKALLCLRQLGDPYGAEALLRAALRVAPDRPDLLANLGLALVASGRASDADALFADCRSRWPEFVEFQWNQAMLRLAAGDYRRGWQDYEARRRRPGGERAFPYPEWDGSALTDKCLLVYAEQGLGDEIMFGSCLGDVIERAAHVVIECEQRLAGLFGRSFPRATVRGAPRDGARGWLDGVPAIDCQIPIGSLPRWTRRDEQAFPAHCGYLRPDPGLVSHWRGWLSAQPSGRRVGLSWRGGTPANQGRIRSIDASGLGALIATAGVQWIALQHDARANERSALAAATASGALRWPELARDMDQPAALLHCLDAVVTVDNSIAHLAGALGRPLHLMLNTQPDWRWKASGATSPWYPSARLYRQSRLGDWSEVLGAVAAALRLTPVDG